MDIQAIIKAYPDANYIDETVVKDKSGNVIATEQSRIDAARTTLNAEAAAIAYQSIRQPLYPSLGDFADAMYWNSKGDSTKLEAYYAACEKVKTDNPKPS
tara:strand:- start:123 stop:422 length:300 start_codon:yes stop_codon:yes gene_type:complete